MHNLHLEFELDPARLPGNVRDIVRHIHEDTGARPEIILPAVLSTMSIACQDCFDVQLKEGPVIPVTSFTIILARSGTGKTIVFNSVTKAIRELEKEFDLEFRKLNKEYIKEHNIWSIEFKAAEKRYRKCLEADSDTSNALFMLKHTQNNEPLKPSKKISIINDCTSEALIQQLSEGYPSLAIMSDEAGGLFESNLFQKSPWLNALWSGQRISSIRASRREYDLDDPRVGLLAMLQPGVYSRYLYRHGEYSRSSGLTGRILMVDLEQVRKPYVIDKKVLYDHTAIDSFHNLVREYFLKGVGRRIAGIPRKSIVVSSAAQGLYEKQSNKMSELIQPGNILEIYDDLGARFMEQTLRIAAVMQVFITPDSTEISRDILESSIHIANWHLDHAIAKLNSTRKRSDAEKIEEWLEDHLVANGSFDFRRNDIIKKGPYSVRKLERLITALNNLEASGKIQQYKENNANYIRFIGSKLSPYKLAELRGLPNWAVGSIGLSKLPLRK